MHKHNKVHPVLPPLNKNSSVTGIPEAENSAIEINRQSRDKVKNESDRDAPQINDAGQPAPSSTLCTCRICLEQHPALHANTQEQLANMLSILEEQQKLKQPQHVIATCHCQGTAAYVHQKCMIQWIDAQYKRSKEKQMKCEICLEEILYDRKTIPYFQFTCQNLQDISACNIACFTSVAIILALFIVLETQATNLKFNELAKLTIYVLIAILIITLGISIAMIIKEAFYKTKKQTTKVYSNDEIQIRGILKENLTHYQRRSTTYRTHTYARSMRSARNSRDLYRSRVNEPNLTSRNQRQEIQRNTHRQRTERPARTNNESREQNNDTEAVRSHRSQRNIRVQRNGMSTRSIQVRSRQEIEDPI